MSISDLDADIRALKAFMAKAAPLLEVLERDPGTALQLADDVRSAAADVAKVAADVAALEARVTALEGATTPTEPPPRPDGV